MVKNRFRMNIHCNHCPVSSRCMVHHLGIEATEKFNAMIDKTYLIEPGEHLYFQQEKMQSIFALFSGSCKEYKLEENGDEKINSFYFPGNLLGLESLSAGQYEFSAIALETSQFCAIPLERFYPLMNQSPALLHRFIHLLSQKIQQNKHIPLTTKAKCRMAAFLLNMLDRQQEQKCAHAYITLSMSQSDIGIFLGLANETVSRVLHLFQRKNIIKISKKEIYITDMSTLKIIAGFYEQFETKKIPCPKIAA